MTPIIIISYIPDILAYKNDKKMTIINIWE